jgi:hypothetical protein
MDERLIDLFTYDCADRTVRTRCARHIATTGPYRMVGQQPFSRRRAPWFKCNECVEEYYYFQDKREDGQDE